MNKLTIRRPILFLALSVIAAAVLAGCSPAQGEDQGTNATSVAPSDASPRTHVFRTGDPIFDTNYRITMPLLEGYTGLNGVVFGTDGGQGMSAWTVANVYADPCLWAGTLLDPPIDASVDGLVAGLAGQKGRHATPATDVSLSGYTGKYMEVTTPAGMDPADCDGGEYRTWTHPFGGQRSLEPDQRDLLWIVDVEGTRVVIDSALGPDTTDQDRADRTQMVESIRIDPV